MSPFRLTLFIALYLLAGTGSYAAEQKRDALTPPPRTIDDITRMLDHYKPDPARVAHLRTEADAELPASEDRNTLFNFYWKRGLAAEKIGRLSQTIADLRKAAEYGEKNDGRDGRYVRMLRNLSSAETVGGNLLNAVRTAEESWRQTTKNQLGQLLAAEQLLIGQYVLLGDFESARKKLREAESAFVLLQKSSSWHINAYNWTALVERARADIFFTEGRYREAEGGYRRGLHHTEMHIQ